MLLDARGRPYIDETCEQTPAVPGADVGLTIVLPIQHELEIALRESVTKHGATSGAGILVRPTTGEIVAMASWPTYDPRAYRDASPDEFRDNNLAFVYESGSTMKPLMAGAAVGEGLFACKRLSTAVRVCGPTASGVRHARFMTTAVKRGGHGEISVAKIVAKSDNIGMAKMGIALGPERLYEWTRRYGFGQRTGIELPGENVGIMLPRSRWNVLGSCMSIPMGHEIAVTPLQMVMAHAGVANEGLWLPPRVVRRVTRRDPLTGAIQAVDTEPRPEARRILPPRDARAIEAAMRLTMTEGTGVNLQLDRWTSAGKTGTTEKLINGRYADDRHIGSFVCWAPADPERLPELVALVVIDDPQENGHYGSQTGGPVVQACSQYGLGLSPSTRVARLSRAARDTLMAAVLDGQIMRGWDGTVPATVVRDSRVISPGAWFVGAAAGSVAARHCNEARAAGASAVSRRYRDADAGDWAVGSPRQVFARADAARRELTHPALLGVTGTDGKTSVVWWLHAALGPGAARVGTLGWHDGVHQRLGSNTTPAPEQFHDFCESLDHACPGIAIECSSHAGMQHRLDGVHLDALAISAITADHLDDHGHRAGYIQAKARLLRRLKPGAVVIVDLHCPAAGKLGAMAQARGLRVMSLGFDDETGSLFGSGVMRTALLQRRAGDWYLSVDDDGVRITDCQVPVAQPGRFNAWNVAAAVLLAGAAGVTAADACARIAAHDSVPGRLEPCAQQPLMLVDYAHTAGALGKVLEAVRADYPQQQLVCVFGCGGDRDPSKRAPMGRAAMAADHAIITNDNPRGESPAVIAAAIAEGCDMHRTEIILDRGDAIRRARALAGDDGVVIVCGKGHETYQIIGDQKLPWDDRAAIRALVAHTSTNDSVDATGHQSEVQE